MLAIAYGPDNADLDYTFDCANDGFGDDLTSEGNGTSVAGSCLFVDEGLYTIGLQVCDGGDGSNCATETIDVTVNNVAPVIDAITTGPVSQGQPVTVTVDASDPGVNDVLMYSFDCDGDGNYEVGPQASNETACPLDPAQASVTITVLVEDGDGGEATGNVVVSQTVTLCGSYFTGALTAPTAGGCPIDTTALTLPGATVTTICINPYTLVMTWSLAGTCGPLIWPHLVPGDGPLAYCQHLWTGKLRANLFGGACEAYEAPNVIPG